MPYHHLKRTNLTLAWRWLSVKSDCNDRIYKVDCIDNGMTRWSVISSG